MQGVHCIPKLDTRVCLRGVCTQELLEVGCLRMGVKIKVKPGMNEDLTKEDTIQFNNLFGAKEGDISETRFQLLRSARCGTQAATTSDAVVHRCLPQIFCQ